MGCSPISGTGRCAWPWELGSTNGTPSSGCGTGNTDCRSVLFGLPTYIQNCSQAMEYIGERLAAQLHGDVLTSVLSTYKFQFDVSQGQVKSVATLIVAGNCGWPVAVTYEKHEGAATSTSKSFGSIYQILKYLVTNLQV